MTYNGEPLDDRLFHTWSMVPSRDEEVAAERLALSCAAPIERECSRAEIMSQNGPDLVDA